MFNLRLLSAALVLLTIPLTKIYASRNVSFNTFYNSVSNEVTGAEGILEKQQSSNLMNVISYTTDKKNNLDFTFSFLQNSPDYSNYVIMDKEEKTSKMLTDIIEEKDEYSVAQNINYKKGPVELNGSFNTHITSSPFKTQGWSFYGVYSFYEASTLVGVQVSKLKQRQPQNYFSDLDMKLQPRPTSIDTTEYKMWWEQIVSEIFKTKWTMSTAKRKNERPRQYGTILESALALTEGIFLKTDLTHVRESRDDDLLNERGYFTLSGGQVSVTYEPVFDLLLSVSYSLGVERESDPRTGAKTQAGLDQYGAGVKYEWGEYQFDVQGYLALDNNKQQDMGLTGGLIWNL